MKNLLAELQAALSEPADKIPRGFKTAKQWAEEWDFQTAHTLKLLRNGVEKGLMEVRKFRTASGAGIRAIPYYGKLDVKPKKK